MVLFSGAGDRVLVPSTPITKAVTQAGEETTEGRAHLGIYYFDYCCLKVSNLVLLSTIINQAPLGHHHHSMQLVKKSDDESLKIFS